MEKDLLVFPPAIPFHPKPKKNATELDEEEKDKFVTFVVGIGCGEDKKKPETTEWSFGVFEDEGDAQEYIKWRIRFEELAEGMHLNTPDKQYTVLQTGLRGEARARFNNVWHSIEIPSNANDAKTK